MYWSNYHDPEQQRKAINRLLILARKRKDGKISSDYFCRKVSRLETDFRVILGNAFLSDISDLACDLTQAEEYRYHNHMTRGEEENLILENIEKFYDHQFK